MIRTNPYLESVRAAYRKSNMYRAVSNGVSIRSKAQREPGEDREELALGLERDSLEQEFMGQP